MPKKILIIDDDPTILKLVSSWFENNGFQVVSTTEADKGLALALKSSPDLIILDVMLPFINGFHICRLLKTKESHKHIPIIFVTVRKEKVAVQTGLEVGANAYLLKPIDRESLMNKVRELLPH